MFYKCANIKCAQVIYCSVRPERACGRKRETEGKTMNFRVTKTIFSVVLRRRRTARVDCRCFCLHCYTCILHMATLCMHLIFPCYLRLSFSYELHTENGSFCTAINATEAIKFMQHSNSHFNRETKWQQQKSRANVQRETLKQCIVHIRSNVYSHFHMPTAHIYTHSRAHTHIYKYKYWWRKYENSCQFVASA